MSPAAEEPPFEISETGWGGFQIDVRLHFQPFTGEKAQWRSHYLQLEKYGDDKQQAKQEAAGCVRAEFLEVVQFNEPTELLFDALTDDKQWDHLDKTGKKLHALLPSEEAVTHSAKSRRSR